MIDIFEQITVLRAKNRKLWDRLDSFILDWEWNFCKPSDDLRVCTLRGALSRKPKQAKKIIAQIGKNDQQVARLLKKLSCQ